MKNFLKKIGGPLVWFGIPVFFVITYQMCIAKPAIHQFIIAAWCCVMSGFIGYSLRDRDIFKRKK